MTAEFYNKICIPYQVLTKRFIYNDRSFYNGFYKCYNPAHHIVRDENLETLRKFENLTFRDIYTEDRIKSQPYGDTYLDSKLVVVDEQNVCLSTELGQVLLYVLVSKLEEGITEFLDHCERFHNQYKDFIKLKDEGKIMKMKLYFWEDLRPNFDKILNFNLVFHLLAQTNSSLVMQDWNNNMEIHINKIKKMIDTLKIFDFSKVDL